MSGGWKIVVMMTAALLGASRGRGADGDWGAIKAGLTRVETLAAVGEPLMRSAGREFELWIYDRGAEIVCFRGRIVAWTAPVGQEHLSANGRQIDMSSVPAMPVEQQVSSRRATRVISTSSYDSVRSHRSRIRRP